MLRPWLRGEGLRAIERLAGIDRKIVRRHARGRRRTPAWSATAREDQLNDVFMSLVVEKVRPHRTDGHGPAWRRLEPQAEKIRSWLDDEDLTVVEVDTLLARQGVTVPVRTRKRCSLCGVVWAPTGPGERRSGWRTESPGTNCRSTSGAWGCSSTR